MCGRVSEGGEVSVHCLGTEGHAPSQAAPAFLVPYSTRICLYATSQLWSLHPIDGLEPIPHPGHGILEAAFTSFCLYICILTVAFSQVWTQQPAFLAGSSWASFTHRRKCTNEIYKFTCSQSVQGLGTMPTPSPHLMRVVSKDLEKEYVCINNNIIIIIPCFYHWAQTPQIPAWQGHCHCCCFSALLLHHHQLEKHSSWFSLLSFPLHHHLLWASLIFDIQDWERYGSLVSIRESQSS